MTNLPPLYEDLTYLAPLSEARAHALVRFVADGEPTTVVDVGCGWGELLLQVLEQAPGATGVGIDLDEASVRHAQERAARRGLGDRVRFVAGDARTPPPSAAAICVGASQIWGPPVEARQPLDYAAALDVLRATVSRGGRVLYGEAVWSRPPTPEAIAPLAGRTDEYATVAELVELVVAHGFHPKAVHEAGLDEWDTFESGFTARYARWLATHDDDHPEAAEITARATRQRQAYFGGYRRVLGMAYLCLLAG